MRLKFNWVGLIKIFNIYAALFVLLGAAKAANGLSDGSYAYLWILGCFVYGGLFCYFVLYKIFKKIFSDENDVMSEEASGSGDATDSDIEIRFRRIIKKAVSVAAYTILIVGAVFIIKGLDAYDQKEAEKEARQREIDQYWSRHYSYNKSNSYKSKNYSSGTKKGSTYYSGSSSKSYSKNTHDWSDGEEFADEFAGDFDSWEDAYEYWEDEHDW